MKLSEKVAALMGFMEGKEVDTTTVEGQIFTKIAEILRDMSYEIEELETRCDDLHDYCDELDSDLGDVEEYLLDELEEDEDEDFDDEDEDDDEVIEAVCPECGEEIFFDLSVDPEDVICPSCGKHVSFVCDGDCDGCSECDEDEE